jgi:hypothetical protein
MSLFEPIYVTVSGIGSKSSGHGDIRMLVTMVEKNLWQMLLSYTPSTANRV